MLVAVVAVTVLLGSVVLPYPDGHPGHGRPAAWVDEYASRQRSRKVALTPELRREVAIALARLKLGREVRGLGRPAGSERLHRLGQVEVLAAVIRKHTLGRAGARAGIIRETASNLVAAAVEGGLAAMPGLRPTSVG